MSQGRTFPSCHPHSEIIEVGDFSWSITSSLRRRRYRKTVPKGAGLQVLKENNSKQKARRRLGSEGVDHPRTPHQHPDWGSCPCPGPGRRRGTGTAAVSRETGNCLSPVLLLKSGSSLRPKYFLWDVAVRTCRQVQDASSVLNDSRAPPCFPALPRSRSSSPSAVFEHPKSWLGCIARLQYGALAEIWP